MPSSPSELNGLLVVDKPGRPLTRMPGASDDLTHSHEPAASGSPANGDAYLLTSHDVVSRVRRLSGQRRIGHTGTLDPMASGVLVLCLGTATRLVEYYQGDAKRYYAEISFGAATDSYDAVGNVTDTAPVPTLNETRIDQALNGFRGQIWQHPPVFSALKQGGEALYAKVRRGETVEVTARQVTFYELTLLEFRPPDWLSLRVVCSAGAYVRSLAHDLGRALGTVAHLAGLRREAAGPFTLDGAHSLPAIAQAAATGSLPALLRPPGEGLRLARMQAADDLLRRLGFGQNVPMISPAGCDETHRLACIYNDQGQLAGIVRRLQPADSDNATWLWKAEKWLR